MFKGFTIGLPARLTEEIPELVSGRLAVLPAKRVKETRPWPWRNEEIGGEEIGVFPTVTAPVYIASHFLVKHRTGLDDRLSTYDLELKEFWTRSCEN
jgi:hypothetical protein